MVLCAVKYKKSDALLRRSLCFLRERCVRKIGYTL